MVGKYTPGSFTKNFSWNSSYGRLYRAIDRGFAGTPEPVTREDWRKRCGIEDIYRQLIPMNFFLYSLRTPQGDFLVRDRLVEVTLDRPYTKEFDQLALFAFHLANSGSWQGSKWKDGHVAGWANELIRGTAWRDGRWIDAAFQEASLAEFLQSRLDGEPSTKRKILTNYRFMLKSAGVLVDGKLQQLNLRQRWFVDAVQLFWDRQIFDGSLPTSSNASAFEESFLENEIYKLFGCDESQGVAFVRAALPEYLSDRLGERVEQLN